MKLIDDTKVRTKLVGIILLVIIGFAAFGVIAYTSMGTALQSTKDIGEGKDLVADILPPPEYIIESYLNTLQLVDAVDNKTDPANIEQLISQGDRLKRDYEDRHTYWVTTLPEGELKTALTVTSYNSAEQFYKTRDEQFIPAIRAGDATKAKTILRTLLQPEYAAHRADIDTTVQLANARNTLIAEDAENNVSAALLVLMVAGLVTGILVVAYTLLVSYSITGPLNRSVAMLESMRTGRLDNRLRMGRRDEIGIMADAMDQCCDMLEHIVAETKTLTAAAVEGRLNARGDAGKFQGEYARMIQGFNSTIGAVVAHLDAIPVPAFIIDRDFSIRYANRATAAMIGLTPEELIGMRCYDHFATPHCRSPDCAMGRCMQSKMAVSSETQAVAKGRTYDIAYSGVPITDAAGNTVGAMEFITDLTDIREAARQARKRVEEALAFINGEMDKIQEGVGEASSSVEEISAGAGQVAKNATAVSMNVERSLESIMQVRKTMEDLSHTIQDVATKSEVVAKIVQDTATYSREGRDLAQKTEQGMHNITRSSNDVNQIILEIKSQMDKIGEIVSLITDLANQTNLLALNAAIEAARAGDAGRGFAVVATEVKSLAVESRASAERIAEMIHQLQVQTVSAVDAVSAANAGVREGSETLQETLASFNRIVTAIEKISQNVSEVAAATEEQAASVEEVTASVNEVGGLMQATTKEAADSAAASEESSAAIDQISRVIGNVTAVVGSVRNEITGFRL